MSENKQGEPADGGLVQSLLRGLELLRLLAGAEEGLTLRELTTASGLKQGTAYKLLQTLLAAGYVSRTERPVHYFLGPAVFGLAASYQHRSLLQRAEVAVRELFAYLRPLNANVVLTEALAGEVEIVLRMSPERPGTLEKPRGRVMTAYSSACSLVFQAFWTDRERREYRQRHPFWEEGAYLWETQERLEAELAGIRQRGFALPVFPGGHTRLLAVPVFEANEQFVAVLGVSMPHTELPEEEWQEHVTRVRAAARALSARQPAADD